MMAWISKVTTILMVAAISSGHLTDDDFRIVNRQDLLSDSDTFEDRSSKSFSQLLFDVGREQVVVGARDALYRLSLRGLRQLERADWAAPGNTAKSCQDKGQTEDDCHNYIKVLLMYKDRLFACGTNAFSPMCTWRELESINNTTEWVTGVANCPCNPHSNVTSLLASGGEYYAGTPTDFTSSDITVCRSRGAAPLDRGTLRTTQYDPSWLNEPQFVGSFEDDTFVYFVFREVAVEFMDCGKIVYSRIARVCKNDSGGRPRSANAFGEWSTFLKARLKCPVPGDVPFYYDEVQSVEYLPDQKILVATFTTPSNSIVGSAVCVYNMSDIRAAFEGPYRVRDKWDTNDKWELRAPSPQAKDHFKCINNQITEYHRYHLMYESVQPISGEPVYKATLERFTHVTVDVIPTRTGSQLIVYVATERSDILKMVVLPRFDGACLVEVLKLKDEKGGHDVRSMQFVKDTMSLYIGSNTGVLRVAGQRCARYKSHSICFGASDPYCGWDDEKEQCVLRTVGEEVGNCPSDDTPVAGGWSSWSEWEPCVQHGTASAYNERGDMCACRYRRCDNPPPKRGGAACEGPSIAVTNCTVHGGWSAWSGWSECSATCGIGVKSRRRGCSAPEPRFGGRVCVGLDVQDMICTDLPPCPDPTLAPVDGGWSAWGPWSPCSSAGGPGCGPAGGWRERRRSCTNPKPKNGGSLCDGPKMEQQICDLRPCELRKATAWTPWVQIPGNTSDSSYTEKRFKFLCKAPSPEQLKLSIAREEERYCTSRGSCTSSPPDDGGWDAWGPWGPCSASCGGGQQARTRRCKRPPCGGAREMLRACNVHACSGEWSCWSDWGECSGGCGTIGHRTRTRACLSPAGCPDAAAALETKSCYSACPESGGGERWGEWGDWSSCDNGERVRRRNCAGDCAGGGGAQIQLAREHTDDSDNELYAMLAYSPSIEMASFVTLDGNKTLSVGGIVGCVLAAFISGCLLCLAGVIYTQRRGSWLPWSRSIRVPSSPHYITKQNSYVTVPLKEVPRKAKRQPSFTGIGGSSGILLAKSNNLANANNHNIAATPKLYPKAIANEYDSMGTLRRHSNQPNNRSNLDTEEDKFY